MMEKPGPRLNVVILSHRTLFMEGVAHRLRQHHSEVDLVYIDPHQASALEQLIREQPVAVILDAADRDVLKHCPLGKWLFSLPATKVIRLDAQQNTFQVLFSQRYAVGEVQDLLTIIQADQMSPVTDTGSSVSRLMSPEAF